MEDNEFNRKCFNHKDEDFLFYCFDDKKFICDKCFKDHKKHNIDIKSELKKNSLIYNKINNKRKSISENLKDIKSSLIEIKDLLDKELNKINDILSSFNNSNLSKLTSNIFNLNYNEYQNIEKYSSIFESIKKIKIKINEIFNEISKKIEYKNFRVINKEVNIIEHSKEDSSYSLDVMLEKKDGEYSLFVGQNDNHFAIFDLKKKLYLKDILISVKQFFGCVLKNFKVSIKDDNGNWEEVNSFCCQDNKNQIDFQKFSIEKETQFVKINFIDAWSKVGGDLILIRRLSFSVADIN